MQQKRIVIERCSQIKEIALRSLQGKWGTVILGMLVLTLISYIPNVLFTYLFGDTIQVKAVLFIYTLLISGSLSFGFCSLCLRVLRGEKASPIEVFYGFERFGTAFIINTVITVIVAVMSALGTLSIAKIGGGYGILLFLVIVVLIVWVELHFILCYYILCDQPELSGFKILRESCRIMKGNKGRAFALMMSFLGWILLWIILATVVTMLFLRVFPPLIFLTLIPLLFLGAYMSQSNAAFYEFTRENSALAMEEAEKARQLESL